MVVFGGNIINSGNMRIGSSDAPTCALDVAGVTGSNTGVKFFADAATGDNPKVEIYGFADNDGSNQRYVTMQVDAWGRLVFGGTADTTVFSDVLECDSALYFRGSTTGFMKANTASGMATTSIW